MLAAKFSLVFELVDRSPYAQELVSAHQHPTARAHVEAAEEGLREVLAGLLRRASRGKELDLKRLGLTVEQLVAQLMQVGHGASYGATSAAEQKKNLGALVASVLRAGFPQT